MNFFGGILLAKYKTDSKEVCIRYWFLKVFREKVFATEQRSLSLVIHFQTHLGNFFHFEVATNRSKRVFHFLHILTCLQQDIQ